MPASDPLAPDPKPTLGALRALSGSVWACGACAARLELEALDVLAGMRWGITAMVAGEREFGPASAAKLVTGARRVQQLLTAAQQQRELAA